MNILTAIWQWISTIWRVDEPRRVNHHMNQLLPREQRRKEEV